MPEGLRLRCSSKYLHHKKVTVSLCRIFLILLPFPPHPSYPASPLSSPGMGIPSSLTRCEATTLSCYVTSRCATSVTWWWKTRKSSLASSKTQNNTSWLFVGHYFLFILWGEKPHERHLIVEFPFVWRTESGALLCVCVCVWVGAVCLWLSLGWGGLRFSYF